MNKLIKVLDKISLAFGKLVLFMIGLLLIRFIYFLLFNY